MTTANLARTLTGAAALALLPALVGGITCSSGPAAASETVAARTTQTATLSVHPQLAQPGTGTRSAGGARSTVTATLRPVREGRTVLLQRRTGSGWDTVAEGRENGRGIAQFNAPFRRNGAFQTYRAVAPRTASLARIATTGQSTSRWAQADFTDQFSGTTLGSAWSQRRQDFGATQYRKCSRGGVPRASRVGNGALRLSVLRDAGPNPATRPKCRTPYGTFQWRANGHISTSGTQAFRYGYAAARIKFQPRRGQHAAFWMQPQTRTATEGSARNTGAEIDVIEWFGNNHPQGGLTSFVYDYPNDGRAGVTPRKTGGWIKNPGRFGKDWASRYHVFSVQWTPNVYIFRIDGKETFRTTRGVSGQPQYLILSLLSSDYEIPHLRPGKLPQHMYVDWVRYWER
ncbi:glycoside hydrolase family 16 protein [Nocardioides guangzhouensis]|uniref:Glycoside hydrolase family 16 protein n=1 Tax=Nocardioides guangzhouensis TaxID=2497878 RepID=A0A4Q4Z632_9ACTN|nr:glycoside hydrolase family 16 protein [Nocardioides guangzhouensis]RYP83163.1 glycoside hydrolase family 16 protein [Nocardioides guangzhouensis]